MLDVLVGEAGWRAVLDRFVRQALAGGLDTSGYPTSWAGLTVKVSFGMGSPARVPWIAFLKAGMKVSEGVYPVYLFYKDQLVLVLAYGVSVTRPPPVGWPPEVSRERPSLREYFRRHGLRPPESYPKDYGGSRVFRAYRVAFSDSLVEYFDLESGVRVSGAELESDLAELLDYYLSLDFGGVLAEPTRREAGTPQPPAEAFCPPFFRLLESPSSGREFEEYTYYLLRLLGVHELFRFKKQAGEPDGFFEIGNLAVIYDTTLQEDFEVWKRTQIENYCAMLSKGRLELGGVKKDVHLHTKQVWIITRGAASRKLDKINQVVVKEVPVSRLIQVYLDRLVSGVDEEGLKNMLENI